MSNDYLSDPPAATSGQLLAISESISQLRQEMRQEMRKLEDVPQKIDRMSMQFDQLQEKQKHLDNNLQQAKGDFEADLDRTKSSLRDEMKQIRVDAEVRHKETDMQIRVLHESKTKIDSVTNLVRWGGIAIIGVFAAAWNNQTAKTDTVNAQAMANSQKIQVLEKQSDQTLRTLEEIRNKLYERNMREEK